MKPETCDVCGSLLSIVTWRCVRGQHCRPAQHPEASPRRTLGRGRNHASLGPGTNKEPLK
jgi:hypothetical protein